MIHRYSTFIAALHFSEKLFGDRDLNPNNQIQSFAKT